MMRDRDHLQSLDKALLILDLIAGHRSPLKLESLVQLSGIKKTSCFRVLKTLSSTGFLSRDPETKAYWLGPKTISIGLTALEHRGVRELALPYMKKLREKTGATVNLAILNGLHVIFVERLQSAYIMEANLRVGSRLSVHCSSMGKAILAFLPEREIAEILNRIRFEPKTGNTIPTKEAFLRELKEIRERGFAVNNEELEIGLFAIAAPLRNHAGEAVAAMNISFPLARHSKQEAMDVFRPMILEACREISSLLGFGKGRHESMAM
jgi:IclR family transcriptional regulator, KDG regulon repressor